MTLIQRICCFFLFAKILLYLCPDESYEAYYSLLLNWALFFVIVTGIVAPQGAQRLIREGEETFYGMLAQTELFQERFSEDMLSAQIRSMLEEGVESGRLQAEVGADMGTGGEAETGENAGKAQGEKPGAAMGDIEIRQEETDQGGE